MTNQVIPTEAIEAAAKALATDEQSAHWFKNGSYRRQARLAIEAAAPYLSQDARIERVKDLCAEEEARQTAKAYIPVDAIRAALRTSK